MTQLKSRYTLVIVTHNLQQALRVADCTAFMSVDLNQEKRTGYLVEIGPTKALFSRPQQSATRDYLDRELGSLPANSSR